VSYPVLIEALERCPPEDVGGPPGYEEFLAALADPDHERHAEMVEWHGEPFDPAAVDLVELNRALQDTVRSCNRTRKAKPT
jgi:Plasmid pRiA4b ORF-3-like protein